MLAAKYKITSGEFKQFFNKGSRRSSKHFRITTTSGEDVNFSKYAVVISKKVLKTAVSRHENKRKIYKIICQLYPQFLSLGFVFIFIQKDIRGVSGDQLEVEIKYLLSEK